MYLYVGSVATVFAGLWAACLIIMAGTVRNAASTPVMPRPLFGLPIWLLAILAYVTGVFLSILPLALLGPSVLVIIGHVGLFSSTLPLSLVYERLRRHRPADESGLANVVRQAIVLLPVCFSLAFLMGLLIESSLSFLGVGVPPPNPSLGEMISSQRTSLAEAPWLWGFPLGVVLVAVGALWAIVFRVGKDPQPNYLRESI